MDTTTDFTVDLLVHYIFDLAGYTPSELIDHWLKDYPARWVRLAVIESLYQGRYKAVSVEQILVFWKRRGQALYHFNHEFERLVCGNFPHLAKQPETNTISSSLDSEKAVSFSNGDRELDTVMTATEVQLVNATANVPSSTNSLAEEPDERPYQVDDTNQKLRLLKSDNPCPIEQFIPDADYGSDFYAKLKAIAQSPEG